MNGSSNGAGAENHSFSDRMLFWASFLTLVAAGIGFSVRGAILRDWGQQFGFTQSELGTITGGGLVGFGVAIIALSFVADRIGYGKLMLLAFLLHASSAVVTFGAVIAYAKIGKAGAFMCLNIGAWLFSLGNGTCEAVINPLTAALFPRNKTHWLNILHAGWPAGLIVGALMTLGFNQIPGIPWEVKLGVFLIPVTAYGVMMFNRVFPRSEATVQGVGLVQMMKEIGLIGAAVLVFFIGLLLSSVIFPSIPDTVVKIPSWAGWVVALVIWILYGAVTQFSFGHLLLAFLYLLHALVGYVELGTDSWITNIGNTVLKNQNYALGAFIWTNIVMCFLRFFAGPIVHKISPVGLLFISALLGTTGLVLFSQPFVDSVFLWVAVSTVYAIGKTFYWPTLLGVISERFPKGGALALGLSGGIGMLSAGILGGPGIGYKQDYFAVEKLSSLSNDTYNRYVARDEAGEPSKKPYPVVSKLIPEMVPPIAGLDNGKLKVFDDYGGVVAAEEKRSKGEKVDDGALKTTLQADLDTLQAEKAKGVEVPKMLEDNLTSQMNWWKKDGKPHYEEDKPRLQESVKYGAQHALLYTAAVPVMMALGFLILILVFMLKGGYKQVHLDGNH